MLSTPTARLLIAIEARRSRDSGRVEAIANHAEDGSQSRRCTTNSSCGAGRHRPTGRRELFRKPAEGRVGYRTVTNTRRCCDWVGASRVTFQIAESFANATTVDHKIVDNVIAEPLRPAYRASEIESKRVLTASGSLSHSGVRRQRDEAAGAATRIGFPVVLKVHSPSQHKANWRCTQPADESEVGTPSAYRRGLAERMPGARFDGCRVESQARSGVELIAGISRSDRFGSLVVVGLAGYSSKFCTIQRCVSHDRSPRGARDAANWRALRCCMGRAARGPSTSMRLPTC